MRQDEGIDVSRSDRKICPIPKSKLLQSLEEAAIEEHARSVVLEEVFRSRHGACGSKKRQIGHTDDDIRLRAVDHGNAVLICRS